MKRSRAKQIVIVATLLPLLVSIGGRVGKCQASTDRPAFADRESGRGSARDPAREHASDPRAVALWAAPDPSLALFEPQVIEVSLGSSGETVVLHATPDGGYTRDGEAFVPGGEVTASSGGVYVLTLVEGTWTATYQPEEQAVPLGTSGFLTLTKAEDGTWSSGEHRVADGATVTGSNGIPYRLSFVNGYWSARVRPEAARIAGTPLFARPREDGLGYRVGTSALLPASGKGRVTVDGAMYHVWMEDDQLRGARFDNSPHGSNPGQANFRIGLNSLARLGRDNKDTVANEANTTLIVGRGEFALGELFAVGAASFQGDHFVSKARDGIRGLRHKAELVMSAMADVGNARSRYLRRTWDQVQTWIDSIFGPNQVVLAGTTDVDEVFGDLDAVLDALSTEAAFQAATTKDSTGVFEAADLDETGARNAYSAHSSDSDVFFGVTGGTRYGAVRTKERSQAVKSLKDAALGAFAYSTIPDTVRTRDIPNTGSAEYKGGTVAVSGDEEFYTGKIELLVRFRSATVHGLIRDIKDPDGNPLTYRYGDVEYISFPGAQLKTNAEWSYYANPGERADIHYEDSFFLPPSSVESTFAGHLLGLGKNAASEAVGVWSVGSPLNKSTYLMGGFGVAKVVGATDEQPAPDEGERSKTIVAPAGTEIGQGILTLRGSQYGPNLTTTATAADWDDEMPLLDAGRRIEESHQIPLGQLFSRQGSERTYSGRNLMGLARQEISQLREDLVKVIALVDETAVWRQQRSRIWDQINERVRARFFGTADRALAGRDYLNDDTVSPGDPRKWSSGYPVSRGGRPDDDEALLAVDTLLEALASPTALEAAIKEHSGGVFTRADGKPFRALEAATVEDVWRRSESRIKLSLGSTDHTRFGAWRKQTAPNAWSAYSDRLGEDENGPNSFAYSPLPQSRLADLKFPVGGSATYQGETVAVQHSTFYEGSIELIAQWHAGLQYQHEAGLLTVAIRDLQNEHGDFLTYTNAVERETAIKALVLHDISILADTENWLYFSDASPSKARLRLAGFADVNLAVDPSVTVSVNGKFVGQLLDGPQGVIGTWILRDGGDTRIGTGDKLYGAFGAELKP